MRFLCLAASIPPELGIPSLNHFRGSIKADERGLDAPFYQARGIYSHATRFYLTANDNYPKIGKSLYLEFMNTWNSFHLRMSQTASLCWKQPLFNWILVVVNSDADPVIWETLKIYVCLILRMCVCECVWVSNALEQNPIIWKERGECPL